MAYLIEARFGDEDDHRNAVQAVTLGGLSDRALRELFIPAGADLVSECFGSQDDVERLLGLVFDAVSSSPLWKPDGRVAFQSVVEGCASNGGVRAWARFIEAAAHHIYDLCDVPAAKDLGARNQMEKVEEELKGPSGTRGQPKASNTEKTKRLLVSIAEARGDWLRDEANERPGLRRHLADRALTLPWHLSRRSPGQRVLKTRARVRRLLSSLARNLRNHDAHGGRAHLSHRARAEVTEACLVLLLSIAARHHNTLAGKLTWDQVPAPPAPDLPRLDWLVSGQTHTMDELVGTCLDHLAAQPGVVIVGDRGVGLSTLARHVMVGAYSKGFYLVPALDRARLDTAQTGEEALMWLLGDDWPSPWLKHLLSAGKVGVVLDGLGLLQEAELERAVSSLERIRASHPTLKYVVLRPPVLPADGANDREWPILGNLNKAHHIRVLGRCAPEAPEQSQIAWWLDRRHLAPNLVVGSFEFIWAVASAAIAFDHASLWVGLDVPRALRPAYQWLGLGLLFKLAGEFDEASQESEALRVPQGALAVAFRRCMHSLLGVVLKHDSGAPDDLLRGLENASLVVREDTSWCWFTQPTLQDAAGESAWWARVVSGWNAIRHQDRSALLSALGLDNRLNSDDFEGAS